MACCHSIEHELFVLKSLLKHIEYGSISKDHSHFAKVGRLVFSEEGIVDARRDERMHKCPDRLGV